MHPFDTNDPWRQADTFDELCELSAQFCEGKITHFNGYGGLDPESDPIAGWLAVLNRHGFLTECSQPGERRLKDGTSQRAYVSGWAKEPLAMRLYCLGLEHGLITLVVPPLEERYVRIPITLDGPHPFSWAGGFGGSNSILGLRDRLSWQALLDLATAWTVEIIDPTWGRAGFLWKAVLEAVEGKPTKYSALCSTGTANEVHEFIF